MYRDFFIPCVALEEHGFAGMFVLLAFQIPSGPGGCDSHETIATDGIDRAVFIYPMYELYGVGLVHVPSLLSTELAIGARSRRSVWVCCNRRSVDSGFQAGAVEKAAL
jgi:hypothetical protein